jgi:hypothetical protein
VSSWDPTRCTPSPTFCVPLHKPLLHTFAHPTSMCRCMPPSLRAVARPPLPAVARPPLCVLLHTSPLRAVARPPPPLCAVACPPGLSSVCRCTPPLLRAIAPAPLCAVARPSMCRCIVRTCIWSEGEGSCSRNRTVLWVTVTLLQCYSAPINIAQCTRTRNHMGTVFSGTGRGVMHGTRGLPMSRPKRDLTEWCTALYRCL